ncbi:MAG: hypothetical protein KGI70_02950 [Patescibacteria group bacterium]|nr:hypothetical protein [Patescibacteria group bacterium]
MSEKWVRDTGLVFALLFLILGARFNPLYLWGSAAFLLAIMFAPSALTPFAWAWLKFAELLGSVMNRVFFGLVFFIVLTPVGFLKRLLSGDMRSLKLQCRGGSAFVDGPGKVLPERLTKPY